MTQEQTILEALDKCECPSWSVDRDKAREALGALVHERDEARLREKMRQDGEGALLAMVEDRDRELAHARVQVDKLTKALEEIEYRGWDSPLRHIASDALAAVRPEPQEQSMGALARADAMLAGDPEWWTVTRWPRPNPQEPRIKRGWADLCPCCKGYPYEGPCRCEEQEKNEDAQEEK